MFPTAVFRKCCARCGNIYANTDETIVEQRTENALVALMHALIASSLAPCIEAVRIYIQTVLQTVGKLCVFVQTVNFCLEKLNIFFFLFLKD